LTYGIGLEIGLECYADASWGDDLNNRRSTTGYLTKLDANIFSWNREKHPKKAMEALVHGIRPLALKQLVKTQLDLDHKHLQNCVLSFFDFVKDKMRPRLELARVLARPG
jgi:hypothetical protein